MGAEGLIALFLGVMALAAKPGPGMVTVATKALSEGLLSVLSFMVGTNLVKILFFLVVVFGFHYLEQQILFLSILIKALAATYLIWTGIQGLQNFSISLPDNTKKIEAQGFLKNFTLGFVMTLSNPFDILFFAGVLPSIIGGVTIDSFDLILASLFVIILADSIVALSYAVPLALSRRFFNYEIFRKLNLISSVVIIVIGLYIGYTAIPAKDLLSVF